jgi:hypothetical protein
MSNILSHEPGKSQQRIVRTLEARSRDRFNVSRVRCEVSNASKEVCGKSHTEGFTEFNLKGKGVVSQHCRNMTLDQIKSPRPSVFEIAMGWEAAMKHRKGFLFLHVVLVSCLLN